MKIIITGATSFIGAVTVRRLLQEGYEIYAVVRPGSKNLDALLAQVKEADAGKLVIVSGTLQKIDQCREPLAAKAPFDAWIHMGWDGSGSDNRTKQALQMANVGSSLAAVRTAHALGCQTFLFTGSQAEYGIHTTQISETTVCAPRSEYGKAKLEFGEQGRALCEQLGMKFIHARIFSVYGKEDHPWTLVRSCIRTWKDGGEMKLSDCTQKWNFLYIEDAAAALVALLTKGHSGIYNVASCDTRILREYVEELYALLGCRGSFAYGERPQNAEGAVNLDPDVRKICADTGWMPKVTFAEGIRMMLEDENEEDQYSDSLL